MKYTRTTVRIETPLKKAVDMLSAQTNMTFQKIINQALEKYLRDQNNQLAKKIVFKEVDLGSGLDNLSRDDYYQDPK